MSDATRQSGPLRRLLLVRAGETDPPRDDRLLGLDERPLSAEGVARMRVLRQHWEWVEDVVTSPLRRARQSAQILARGHAVRLDDRLRAMDCGIWHGLSEGEIRALDETRYADWRAGRDVEIPRGESLAVFHARVDAALSSLREAPQRSLLVVTHQDVCRRIVEGLSGRALPDGRPLVGERVLLTCDGDDRWRLGRRSSDPPALRSALERDGLGAEDGDVCDESTSPRHVGALQLAFSRDAARHA